jgi:acyl carrier protein
MGDVVLDRLVTIVTFVAGSHRVPPDLGAHTPITTGGLELDSAAVLELILACEAEFSLTFDPRVHLTEEALRTLGTLATSVRAILAGRA